MHVVQMGHLGTITKGEKTHSTFSVRCDLLLDARLFKSQVVRKVDNAIHRANRYLPDSVVCFANTSPLDSDLFPG